MTLEAELLDPEKLEDRLSGLPSKERKINLSSFKENYEEKANSYSVTRAIGSLVVIAGIAGIIHPEKILDSFNPDFFASQNPEATIRYLSCAATGLGAVMWGTAQYYSNKLSKCLRVIDKYR